MTHKNDLTIMGGGLAGLSLALQCRQQLPHGRITVLEKREHPAPEAAFKVGESTVEVAAHYFGVVLGLKDHLQRQQLPKLGLRFFFPAGDNRRIEDRLELGGKRYAPCPSYQLDRGRFENFLADRCVDEGVQFIPQATVKDIQLRPLGRRHQVTYAVDGRQECLSSRWIVDASGRQALLKRQLGLQQTSAHVGNAAWFRFRHRIKIDDWTDDVGWQSGHHDKTARWYSTNHFMGQGYWVWIIPLSSGSTSMGIVAAEPFHALSDFNSIEKAVAWLELHEPQCAAVVKHNLEHLQDFRAIKHYATECKQVFSRHRWGITGEAGFFHDPFYSPGSDFIAFSNTFLCDLIRRDLTGRGYRIRAYTYDRIFKRFYYGTATAYQDQYQIFGNPTVMPVKILWDYLVYWSITGFIFMQQRLCQQTIYLRNLSRLTRLGNLNHFMQGFFRRWHQHTDNRPSGGTVDISQIPLIREANQRLLAEMDDRSFLDRFAANVQQLETLAAEIVQQADIQVEFPFSNAPQAKVLKNAFKTVFEATQLESTAERVEL